MQPEPTVTCTVCGRVRIVRPDGRGFPPNIAKRKLAKECKADGHEAQPVYMAGVHPRIRAAARRITPQPNPNQGEQRQP